MGDEMNPVFSYIKCYGICSEYSSYMENTKHSTNASPAESKEEHDPFTRPSIPIYHFAYEEMT